VTRGCTVFTVGHSSHSLKRLIDLLARHRITAVADVRSKPYSRSNPQFNKEDAQRSLRAVGLAYVFMGHQLGGRPTDRQLYIDGKLNYDLLARTPEFLAGLDRVIKGARIERIALMCAEKDPLACHRGVLISRHLVDRAITVTHILGDGRLETHADSESRLLREVGIDHPDLFSSNAERIAEAYERRGQQIAFGDGHVDMETSNARATR